MEKRRVIKDDGRYLIFYGFERPVPKVHPDQVREPDQAQESGERRDAAGMQREGE